MFTGRKQKELQMIKRQQLLIYCMLKNEREFNVSEDWVSFVGCVSTIDSIHTISNLYPVTSLKNHSQSLECVPAWNSITLASRPRKVIIPFPSRSRKSTTSIKVLKSFDVESQSDGGGKILEKSTREESRAAIWRTFHEMKSNSLNLLQLVLFYYTIMFLLRLHGL